MTKVEIDWPDFKVVAVFAVKHLSATFDPNNYGVVVYLC